jgi:hypothetical protein
VVSSQVANLSGLEERRAQFRLLWVTIDGMEHDMQDLISQLITSPALPLLIGLLFVAAYLLLPKRADDSVRPRALL